MRRKENMITIYNTHVIRCNANENQTKLIASHPMTSVLCSNHIGSNDTEAGTARTMRFIV